MPTPLQTEFGQIDIYLFDQLLRDNIAPHMRVLDAGCGFGRNLVYLLRHGCHVFAQDSNPDAVTHTRALMATLNPTLPADNVQLGDLARILFADSTADVVLCSAVLHFARDRQHFEVMLWELWRVLRPGGLLFVRLGTRTGMHFQEVAPDLYLVDAPTGNSPVWFLPTIGELLGYTDRLGATLVDSIKTTVVHEHRAMTTWVLRKAAQER